MPSDINRNLSENYGPWRTPGPDYITHLESPSMLDKGGLIHILVGRMILAKALKENMPAKVQRTIKVMSHYKTAPHAMAPDLEKTILNWCHQSLSPKSTTRTLIEA